LAPVNTGSPLVSGAAQVGQTLTGSDGSWTGTAPITFARQWRVCDAAGGSCADIGGATGSAYTPVAGDVGKTLRLRITASNLVGSVSADSAPSAVVIAASPGGGGGGGGGGLSVPDLSVAMVANAAAFAPGGEADVVVTVANKGGAGSLDTHLVINLPATMTLLGPPAYERGSGCTGSQKIDCFLDYIPNQSSTKVVFAVKVSGSGAQQISATASSDRDSNPADNNATLTLQITPPSAPLQPPAAVKPVFGKAVAQPRRPLAGKRFTLTLPVKRSDSGAPLTAAARIVCTPSIAGTVVKHSESFQAGKARLSLVVPKTAKGKQLTITIKISSGNQTASKTTTYQIH
jgi:hypothetical protein